MYYNLKKNMRVFNFSHTAQEAFEKDRKYFELFKGALPRINLDGLTSEEMSGSDEVNLMDRYFCLHLNEQLISHINDKREKLFTSLRYQIGY